MRTLYGAVAAASLFFATSSYASAQEIAREQPPVKIRTEIAKVSAGGCVGRDCSGEKAVSNPVCRPPDPGYKLIPGSEEIHHTMREDDHGTISPNTAVTVVDKVTPDKICIIATAWPVASEHQARAAGYATVWQKKPQ